MEADVFPVFDGKCQSFCTAHPDGEEPFSLFYKPHKEGFVTYIDLQIGDSSFTNLRIAPRFIADASPPFHKYVFPKHTMYGLSSTRSAHNSYSHYFMRTRNNFNYLGRFSSLLYDTELDRFLSFIKVGGEIIRFYYRFEGDRLVEDEDF